MTDDKTPDAPPAPPSEVKINVGGGGAGAFTLEDFNQATGTEIEDLPNPLLDEEAGEDYVPDDELEESDDDSEDELEDDEDGDTDESEDEDGDDESDDEDGDDDDSEEDEDGEEEDSEDADEPSDVGTISAKTPDGEEYEIPENIIVLQKVDGELQEIPLREHLNIVAGELTVNQRLGKLSSAREEMKKTVEQNNAQMKARLDQDAKLLEHLSKGQTLEAVMYLADLTGDNPAQILKSMHASVASHLKSFRGKSRADMDNFYLQVERDWERSRSKKRQREDEFKAQESAFISETEALFQEKGITYEQFDAIHSKMIENGDPALEEAQSDPRKIRDVVVRTTIEAKRAIRMIRAIESVNPKLENDAALIRKLEKAIDLLDYDDDQLAELVREHAGEGTKRRASNLSRKAKKTNKAVPKKKSDAKAKKLEGKKLRGMEDLNKAFGFSY